MIILCVNIAITWLPYGLRWPPTWFFYFYFIFSSGGPTTILKPRKVQKYLWETKTRWWFQICFIFTPKIGGNDPHFDEHIFQRGGFETTNSKNYATSFAYESIPANIPRKRGTSFTITSRKQRLVSLFSTLWGLGKWAFRWPWRRRVMTVMRNGRESDERSETGGYLKYLHTTWGELPWNAHKFHMIKLDPFFLDFFFFKRDFLRIVLYHGMKINIKAGSFWVRSDFWFTLSSRIWICQWQFSKTLQGAFWSFFATLFDQHILGWSFFFLVTLPETNIFAPENGWLEYDSFLLGLGLFSGAIR